MKKTYANHVSTVSTPQTEKIFGSNQVKNNAGGFSFELSDWDRLNRFLILGSEGGTYYVSEHKLTLENANAVLRCINENGKKVIDIVVQISDSGRAPKNDPAIFVLALVIKFGNEESRSYAYKNLSKVCRISTHLFQFINILDQVGKGFGSGLTRAIASWYNEKPLKDLAYQVIKYREREQFTHRDALRLAHVKTQEENRQEIYRWISWNSYKNGKDVPVTGKSDKQKETYSQKHEQISNWIASHYSNGQLTTEIHPLINAFEKVQKSKSSKEIISLIEEFNLPREVVPTEFLNNVDVWRALLKNMPFTAMVRNIATMTRIGLLKPMSDEVDIIVSKLANKEAIKKSRVHPLQLLSALKTYSQGHGFRSENTWTPIQKIVDALDDAFYTAFDNVTPTGKRIMLSLDVSGSMEMGTIAGVPGLNPKEASGAMAMVTAKVESNVIINGFTSGNRGSYGFGNSILTPLNISGKTRLNDVINTISGLPFGGTDCSLPMVYALQQKIPVDAFVIYTDNETYAGNIHPSQALKQYRKEMGIPAKLIVVGMTATEFTIADPKDSGMMDVVGFDTAAPQIMSDFIK